MAIITISRQFGAGGKTLTEEVAARLNYAVAHEEIIEHLTDVAKLSDEGVGYFEAEHPESTPSAAAAGAFSPKRFIDRIFDSKRKDMNDQQYAELLHKIIPQIAAKGNVIILGRGAQFILNDYQDTTHVLLVAEEKDRIKFIQDHYDLAYDQAREAVIKQGKRRLKLMKLFHSEDYDLPVHYDLVLNMSKMEMDRAVELVCALIED
jgi:cytidylate kinase